MTEFFSMGGYGFYVWGSYVVTAVFMIVEVIWVMRRRKTVFQRLSTMRRLTKSAQVKSGSVTPVQATSIRAVATNTASTQPK